MSDQVNRRTFLQRAAQTAAAGALLGNHLVQGEQSQTQPATQPALEWRNKQPTMSYAKLGRTGFMTSRCVFGAGGVYRNSRDMRLLEMAIDKGINYIDTGREYGSSEAAIAEVMKRQRDKVFIVSKAAHIGWPDMTVKPGEDAKAAKVYTDQLEESLRQMQVETIDCYMVQGVEHEWVVTMDALYDAFCKARKAGKVRYFGLATHTNIVKVCELAAKSGRYDAIMMAVNPNSLAQLAPTIETLHEAGIGTVAMKVSGAIRESSKESEERYGNMFADQKLSAHQQAFAYLLFRGKVDAFISHINSRQVLEENVVVPTLKLGQAQLESLRDNAVARAQGACRHCGDCIRSCQQDVRPADLLRCHAYLHIYHEADDARRLYENYGRAAADRCLACGTCRGVCPEGIDLPKVISNLRSEFA